MHLEANVTQISGIITKNSTNDSAEGTSTNEEDATINVNLAGGRYSKKKGKIFFIHTLFIFAILKHLIHIMFIFLLFLQICILYQALFQSQLVTMTLQRKVKVM